MSTRRETVLRTTQWLALGAGCLLLLTYAGARARTYAASTAAVARFEEAREALATGDAELRETAARLPVDKTLWANGRIAKYEESLAHDPGLPLAVLRIPEIELAVPVFAGTGEVVLDRAVGHITGTALPGENGNVGVAGHRDGFFRGLKELELGDHMALQTLDGEVSFVIDDLRIVEPDDVSVLDPTPAATLTLVTCYPFYFVGSAPQRYIVRAREVAATQIGN